MVDINTDKNFELIFKNGDFKVGYADEQHQHHILYANKGEYKEHPEIGVGIVDMLNNDLYTELMLEAKKQLEYDGMQVNNIKFDTNDRLSIDGQYKKNPYTSF